MTKSVVNKNHDTILQCCLVKNLVRDLFMGENNGTKLLVLPLLFFNPQSLHISLEFKNLFEVLSFLRRRFDLPCSRSVDYTKLLHCVSWTLTRIELPDLCAAWMQMACSLAMQLSERSSVSRRPCVGSEGDPRWTSHCYIQTESSSCLRHCYERKQQRQWHLINESGVSLHRLSFQHTFTNADTHTHKHKHTYTQWW